MMQKKKSHDGAVVAIDDNGGGAVDNANHTTPDSHDVIAAAKMKAGIYCAAHSVRFDFSLLAVAAQLIAAAIKIKIRGAHR